MVWSEEQVREFAERSEVEVVAPEGGGAERAPVTVWAVVADGVPYLRSFRGAQGRWYRRMRRNPDGAVRVGGARLPVHCEPVTDEDVRRAVDDAYRRKYGGSPYVDTMLSADSVRTTLRLEPR